MNPTLAWVEIDLKALRSNLRVIKSKLSSGTTQILAIVKADAYGHGMKQVASVLKEEGVSFFGVANIDEACELRKVCRDEKILVLGSFHQAQVARYVNARVIPTVSSLEDALILKKIAAKLKRQIPVHVKVDTGMGRLGIWYEDAPSFFKQISQMKELLIDGVYTHFSSADKKDKKNTQAQLKIFEKVITAIEKLGIKPRYYHAANSMGLLRFKNAHLNLVRPGIVLYGMNPTDDPSITKNLKPVLSFKTKISFLKEVSPGRSISYGATHQTKSKTVIATLPVGYSHGYRVGFSNKAQVIVRGKKCPVVGRVTMDQTLIDVGSIPNIKRWEEVTLIGQDQNTQILAQELANFIDSIPYEVTCSIHPRVPRFYIPSQRRLHPNTSPAFTKKITAH